MSFATPTAARRTVSLSATGGSGAYTWTATGGDVTQTGVFTAPASAGVATVKVRDSLGNEATSQISIGGALTINPPTVEVLPGEQVAFTAKGGGGSGYSFILLTSPAVGGSIDAGSGVFTAGPRGNVVETVQVSDKLGNRAIASVTVGPAPVVTPPPPPPNPPGTEPGQASSSSGNPPGSTPPGANGSSSTSSSGDDLPVSTVGVGGDDRGRGCDVVAPKSTTGGLLIGIGLAVAALRRRRR